MTQRTASFLAFVALSSIVSPRPDAGTTAHDHTSSGSTRRGATRDDVPDSLYVQFGARPEFAAAAMVQVGKVPSGSATLVGTNWCLTAAHVVKGKVVDSISIAVGGDTVAAAEVRLHPGYLPPGVPSGSDYLIRKGVDLALVRLVRPIVGATPIGLYRGLAEVGRVGAHVGYGTAGRNVEILTNPIPIGTRRGGTNAIDAVGGTVAGRHVPSIFLVTDFDFSGDSSHNAIGSASPQALEILGVGGDSGGPLFIREGGEWQLAGVLALVSYTQNADVRKYGVAGSLNFWTRVTMFATWIDQEIKE